MRNARLLLCCVVLAGCSRGVAGNLPIPAEPSGSLQAAQRSEPFGRGPSRATATLRFLYNFKALPDGRGPDGTLLEDGGVLYGVTYLGGTADVGTVYKLTPGTEKVIHNFARGSEGAGPVGKLVDVNGILYGVTRAGGTGSNGLDGTVYKVTKAGREKVIYNFKGLTDSSSPSDGLVNFRGTLYGTTGGGGSSGNGTVYKVTTSGNESVIYSFVGGLDGAIPFSNLVALNGALYGTTYYGGGSGCTDERGCGTVFKVTPSGAETVVYRFQGGADGESPLHGLTNVGGILYGTTHMGGGAGSCVDGCGVVYKVAPSGAETVLHRFAGGLDGASPSSDLLDVNGTFYGSTFEGGGTSCYFGLGCGTVFKITPSGTETVIYRFIGGSGGANPYDGLTEVNGKLYGISQNISGGNGTVFGLSL